MTARRHFDGSKLVLASHNPGKVREIADLLAPFAIEVTAAGDLGLAEPEETGRTFEENALIKAHATAAAAGLPALADDSGLAVESLRGAPGINSARWAGPDKDFRAAMERVQRDLEGHADRRAHFACVLALAWPDGHAETFAGRVDGVLVWPPRGSKGFGYDPMFQADGFDMTFGEMEPDAKHAVSHRADAFGKLVDGCFKD